MIRYSLLTRCGVLAAVALLLCGSAATAEPPECDTTFHGSFSNIWQTDANWTNDAPNANKVGCIPAGKSVIVSDTVGPEDVEAKAIYIVRDSETEFGMLTLKPRTSLTLYEDSTVDGRLIMNQGSELRIAGNLTITGEGGDIMGVPDGYPGLATIRDVGETSYTLVLQGADNDARATSLVVHGFLEIKVRTTNNAFVVADGNGQEIRLTTYPKDGSGEWAAENGSWLLVQVSVSGSGTWRIDDAEGGGHIQTTAACTNLTGRVILEAELLDIQQDFETTGHLRWKSVPKTGGGHTTPRIQVAHPYDARFRS